MPGDLSKVQYSEEELAVAKDVITVVDSIEQELKLDEDPGKIDFDDVGTIIAKNITSVPNLIRYVASAPNTLERIRRLKEAANMAERAYGLMGGGAS